MLDSSHVTLRLISHIALMFNTFGIFWKFFFHFSETFVGVKGWSEPLGWLMNYAISFIHQDRYIVSVDLDYT